MPGRDAEALTGLLSILLGDLVTGRVDDRTAAELSTVFADSGLLGELGERGLSVGRLAVAVEDLLGRSRDHPLDRLHPEAHAGDHGAPPCGGITMMTNDVTA